MKYQDLIEQSLEELRIKTAAHDGAWHLGEADWQVDQESGEILFTAPGGITATCPVQIIGTFDSNDSTWLWAWDNPSIEPALCEHASKLREYGETAGIAELTTRKLPATQDDCWKFTALACKLNEAQGGYRGPAGSTLVFMTFGEPRLTQTDDGAETAADSDSDQSDTDFTADVPPELQDVVSGFIAALYQWETDAYRMSAENESDDDDFDEDELEEDEVEDDESEETDNAIKEQYAAIIREWCTSDVTPQSISYGSEPSHNPETEGILSAAVAEDAARVRTRHTDSTGFASDYEYHLRREDGNWRVANLFVVFDDEKYECL